MLVVIYLQSDSTSTWLWSWVDGSGQFYRAVYDGDTLSEEDSEALMYTNWREGDPDAASREECLRLRTVDEEWVWDTSPCDSDRSRGYLCGK